MFWRHVHGDASLLGFLPRVLGRCPWLHPGLLWLAYHVEVKRLWLFWLLAFCLSGQALSGSWATAAVCPVWAGQGAAQWVDPATTLPSEPVQVKNTAHPAVPDCCNDLLTYLSTGQSCKAGQDCAMAQPWAFDQAAGVTAAFASTTVRWPGRTAGKFANGPQRIWRPPTFV